MDFLVLKAGHSKKVENIVLVQFTHTKICYRFTITHKERKYNSK